MSALASRNGPGSDATSSVVSESGRGGRVSGQPVCGTLYCPELTEPAGRPVTAACARPSAGGRFDDWFKEKMIDKETNLFSLFVLSNFLIVNSFVSPSNSVKFFHGNTVRTRIQPKNLLSARAVATESVREDAEQSVLKPPSTANVFWKDASPQRTIDKKQISWINQFPNTWQPAEKLVLSKENKSEQKKETLSTAGYKSAQMLGTSIMTRY